jgi:hypothetical protein
VIDAGISVQGRRKTQKREFAMNRVAIHLALLLLCVTAFLREAQAATPSKPNVLFIAVDDMNDWSWNGSPVATDDAMSNSCTPVIEMPNVERLAREGMKFYPVDGVAHRLQAILDTEFDGKTVREQSLAFCLETLKLGKLIKESR